MGISGKYSNLKSGHDVTVVASNFIDDNEKGRVKAGAKLYYARNGVKIRRIDFLSKIPQIVSEKLKLFQGLYLVLEEEKPDIIFHHGSIGFTLQTMKQYKRKHQQCRCLIDNHSDEYNCGQNIPSKIIHRILWRKIMKSTIPYVDKYFGVLPLRCRFLNKIYGIPKEKIELMIMGVDDEKVKHIDSVNTRIQIRKKYHIDTEDFLIITGGKIDSRKNIHLLMRAVNQMFDTKIKLLIFGVANTEMKKIIEKNLSEKIRFIGWVDAEYVYDLFSAADLAIFPGTHSVLWEQACAVGLPAIFNKMSGIQHVNINGNALFVSNPTPEKLEKEIAKLCDKQGNNYKSMKDRAKEASKYFLYSRIEKQMFTEKVRE